MTSNQRQWAALCAALVIPFTAILHHSLFYRPTCMLNPFGPEYTFDVIALWLGRDPSLPWGMVAAASVYAVGVRAEKELRLARQLRSAAIAFLIAFSPLSLWIWDVPGLGRPVCTYMHDSGLSLPGIGAVRTRYLYLLGVVLFVAIQAGWRIAARQVVNARDAHEPNAGGAHDAV